MLHTVVVVGIGLLAATKPDEIITVRFCRLTDKVVYIHDVALKADYPSIVQ